MLLGVVVVGMLMIGCGGGDESAPSAGADAASNAPDSTLGQEATQQQPANEDQADFAKRASAACQQGRSNLAGELTAYVEGRSADGSPEEVLAGAVKTILLPDVEADNAAVRSLKPPAGDEKQIEAILAEQEAAVNTLKKRERLESFAEAEQLFKEPARRMRKYGFTSCMYG